MFKNMSNWSQVGLSGNQFSKLRYDLKNISFYLANLFLENLIHTNYMIQPRFMYRVVCYVAICLLQRGVDLSCKEKDVMQIEAKNKLFWGGIIISWNSLNISVLNFTKITNVSYWRSLSIAGGELAIPSRFGVGLVLGHILIYSLFSSADFITFFLFFYKPWCGLCTGRWPGLHQSWVTCAAVGCKLGHRWSLFF